VALVLIACESSETGTETEAGTEAEIQNQTENQSEDQNQADPSNAMPGVDPFCDTRPKIDFCEDFDFTDLPGAFDEQRSNLSTMSLDDGEASSIPRSLLITVEPGGYGELRHQFDSGGKLRLFGMLYVSELGKGEIEIGSFELGDYRIGFGASEDGSLWAYEGDKRLAGNGSLPIGKWASFRWDVNLYDDGTGTAKLRFGNDFIVDTEELTTPIDSNESPIVTVGLSKATGAWAMRFDNITVAIEETVQ
jgi:hypothetical protein